MNVYDFYITPEEYDIASNNGISKKLLELRIRQLGWGKQRAITEKPQSKNKIKDWIKIANDNGICEGTFLTRIRKLKWSNEKAATTPIGDRHSIIMNCVEMQRKYPKQLVDLAKKNGIDYNTFNARIVKQKLSIYDAATIPLKTKEEVARLGNEAYISIYGHSFGAGGR